jgi:NAD(P)-dependent dehydrogenase (short-subunit alcohol dehydrogenase family)
VTPSPDVGTISANHSYEWSHCGHWAAGSGGHWCGPGNRQGVCPRAGPVGAYLGGGGAYAVSKVALLGITQGFARELGQHGITVNAIAPGLVFTEATLATVSDAARDAMVNRAAIPIQGQPRDLTSALLFFASEESRWVTGQTLIVDGGLSTRL